MNPESICLRDVTHADGSPLGRIWREVFDRDEPSDYRTPLLRPKERGYVAERDGRSLGGYSVVGLDLTRGSATLPCGGIARVAVLPECRHLGVGYAMMRQSLAEMRGHGQVIAALYAFRESYYRKFGYEIVGRRWLIRCPQHRLPRLPQNLEPRRIAPEDVRELDAAYVPFARAMHGAHLRDADDWRTRLGRKPPMIYAVGDPVQAYAWTAMHGDPWDDLVIGEFAWGAVEGYRAMLAFLVSLCVNRSALIWHEPSRSPFLATYLDQGASFALDRLPMARCLDVPGALRLLAPETTGEFTLGIADPLLPENEGPWRVAYGPDGVVAEPASQADVQMDVRAFAQALLGEPSLADLLASGRVEATDAGARAACALLTPGPVTLTEFF